MSSIGDVNRNVNFYGKYINIAGVHCLFLGIDCKYNIEVMRIFAIRP